VTTWLRQSTVPHDHPAFLGALGYGAHEVSEKVVRDADVLLALGCRFSEFSTKLWTLLSPGARLVHVDIDPVELGRVYLPDVGLVADAQLAAGALGDALAARAPEPDPDRAARLTDLRARLDRATSLDSDELAADDPGSGVSSISAVRALQGLADRDGLLLVQDAPSVGPWTHRHLGLSRPRSFFGSAGGAMAWGLPAGTAASGWSPRTSRPASARASASSTS
jgi:acetolactate synthase-1/2/3 large subunit